MLILYSSYIFFEYIYRLPNPAIYFAFIPSYLEKLSCKPTHKSYHKDTITHQLLYSIQNSPFIRYQGQEDWRVIL